MTAEEHYESHLAHFYSWMAGDFTPAVEKQRDFFLKHDIIPKANGIAIDLGAGHGIQTLALLKSGFSVTAIDFSEILLKELEQNCAGFPVNVFKDDIRNIGKYAFLKPELIVCCGDTITHLDNLADVQKFLKDCAQALAPNGKLLLTFRDYTQELRGENRFIPVKSDDTRILTCILEHEEEFVNITDLLHERSETGWKQKVSSYRKVRLQPEMVVDFLQENGFKIELNEVVERMNVIIALKN
ncbi:MAG TPA: class I SAM-dependent methyltransferase [Patescibacteria group bacterium]|nr:class I SAM-dependent methyltransferase [Patescibacteria group bacterium]